MQEYHGPYYSLEEAQEILSIRHGDLAHAVRTEHIAPVVYTKARPMLIFSHRNKRNYGHATCLYRGHMSLSSDSIVTLLDGEPINLNKGYGTLLDAEGVRDYRTGYPFKQPTPRDWLYDWSAIEQDTLSLEAARATLLPKEYKPTSDIIQDFIDTFDEHLNGKDASGPGETTKDGRDSLALDFWSNSSFNPQDLRIPASEIKRYKQDLATSSVKPSSHDDANTNKTIVPGSRTNQLHTLITRILTANPDITAKAAWRVVLEDSDRDEPLFDTDNILQIVDQEGIAWRSRDGNEQTIKWASFQSLLSKLKHQLKEA